MVRLCPPWFAPRSWPRRLPGALPRASASGLLLMALAPVTPARSVPVPSSSGPGFSGKADPARPPLADVIACRLDLPEWTQFAAWFANSPHALALYGLSAQPGTNGFLADYRLARPISVFGRTTDHIAFTAAGVMAVFSGITPQSLAAELQVEPAIDLPEKYLGERLIAETPLEGGDPALKATARIALNVSTVTSHPGMTLAGCSYQVRFAQ